MELVAERFVRRPNDDWRDLATGARVVVHVRPLPGAWRERQRHLAGDIARGRSPLIDFGRLGVGGWFEARHAGTLRGVRAPEVVWAAADRLARVVTLALSSAAPRHTTVVAVVNRRVSFDATAAAIATRLRHAGIVAARAGPFAEAGILRMVEHRHVVVLAWTDHDRRALGAWTMPDRATGRPRVVIHLRRGSGGPLSRVSVSSIPEVHPMSLSELLSPVLEIIHEAEDEASALSAVARWLRRTAGADAVAFVGAGSSRPIAAHNWTDTDEGVGGPTDDTIRRARVVIDDGLTRVDAPIRYAGAVIGALKAVGPASRRDDLARAVDAAAALCAPAVRVRLDTAARASSGHAAMPEILGTSAAISALRESIARAAATPFAVLLEGESGTGKELAARAIHRLSTRRDRRFCAVNSAALTDELFEAELFGHARGAFTGAAGPRTGLFEEASGGTLFLDEAGELTPRAQAKLLRALQEGEIRRVGENTPRQVNVRIVAATNRPLADMVTRGTFREDLLFRLAVIRIRMPPLRERVEDVQILALASWSRLSQDAGIRARMTPDALARLSRHPWPGNVRQLQNVVAGLVMIAPQRGRVTARHVDQILGAPATGADENVPLGAARRHWERRIVARALARHGGRRSAAARELGLTRQGLVKAIKRLGLGATVRDRHAGVA